MSETTIEKKSRFATDEDRKKYFREKMRERRGGFRRHPYILDDGSRYSEIHGIKKRKGISITCPLCLGTYWDIQKETHLLTEKHQYAMRIEKNIVDALIKKWTEEQNHIAELNSLSLEDIEQEVEMNAT